MTLGVWIYVCRRAEESTNWRRAAGCSA